MPPAPGFVEAATAVIAAIPAGEVMTYGEAADEAGFPGASRAVGRLLAASGRLVPGNQRSHARHLTAEGVGLNAGRTRVRMADR